MTGGPGVGRVDLKPVLMDGPLIARVLGVHSVTIRKWAHAGYLTRHGTDPVGRAVYDYDQVLAVRDTPWRDRVRVVAR